MNHINFLIEIAVLILITPLLYQKKILLSIKTSVKIFLTACDAADFMPYYLLVREDNYG